MSMSTKQKAKVGAPLAALALFLIGCGSGSPTASTENKATSGPAAESSAAPAESSAAPATSKAAPPAAKLGTRENPFPIGTAVDSQNYQVTLGAPVLDNGAAVEATNEFNDPAPEGMSYATVPVTVTYTGPETGNPWIDLTIEFVSAAGTTHAQFDTSVVGPEPDITDINDLYPGASATGNVTIAIPVADAAAGRWTVSELFSDPVFFAAQ